jgi:hypothetical protein
MKKEERCGPWYHGSPEKLTILRRESWVTPFVEVAKAFAHKPSLISFGDEGSVKHDGQVPAFLYIVDEVTAQQDICYLRDTAQTHWQTQRDLCLKLVSLLPIDDPPQLSTAEIEAMRRQAPKGDTGFVGEPDRD